jgi:ribonuclease P protein component
MHGVRTGGGAGGTSDADGSEGASRSDQRFPRSYRLRRREEFVHAQREGTRVHTPHFVLVVLPRTEGGRVRRLGITVTKRVAGAVGRNRVKRVVREVFRRNRLIFPEGCDVVVIAKSGAPELGYEQVAAELSKVRGPLAGAARRARQRETR